MLSRAKAVISISPAIGNVLEFPWITEIICGKLGVDLVSLTFLKAEGADVDLEITVTVHSAQDVDQATGGRISNAISSEVVQGLTERKTQEASRFNVVVSLEIITTSNYRHAGSAEISRK